jgi:Holliday junction resolvase RusA-like endonuclease
MDDRVVFQLAGLPMGQPRHRIGVINGHARAFEAPKSHPIHSFKAALKIAAQGKFVGAPWDGPIAVKIVALFPRPKRLIWSKRLMPRCWHTAKPDADNIEKAVWDSLSKIVWRDDSQICTSQCLKAYASGDEGPSTTVEVWKLNALE